MLDWILNRPLKPVTRSQSTYRSSRSQMFCEIDVLNDFAKITGKHLHQSLFFKKVAAPQPTTSLKKRLRYTCFPFVKFLRTPFLQNTSGGCFCVWWKKKIYQKLFSSHFPIFQKFSFHFFFAESWEILK